MKKDFSESIELTTDTEYTKDVKKYISSLGERLEEFTSGKAPVRKKTFKDTSTSSVTCQFR